MAMRTSQSPMALTCASAGDVGRFARWIFVRIEGLRSSICRTP